MLLLGSTDTTLIGRPYVPGGKKAPCGRAAYLNAQSPCCPVLCTCWQSRTEALLHAFDDLGNECRGSLVSLVTFLVYRMGLSYYLGTSGSVLWKGSFCPLLPVPCL